ncbi:hypothetical protein CAOG_010096 [Capsaspora owczarzaki ATCC 30864]|uniref:Uncharacterized protein n=1 Tax=Capsaspora owczarzaki (strain ATCC 30864) TaxID=595528 RepID=A0A0D2X557_CAPO3|nr:hypothetical protein CAOG_010096 [Capsaspora owczarzaki ATCC 30864]
MEHGHRGGDLARGQIVLVKVVIVRALAVLDMVQTVVLLLFRDGKASEAVNRLHNHKGDGGSVGASNNDARHLVAKQPPAATVDHAVRNALVNARVRCKASGQRSDNASQTVHRADVQGIVNAQAALDEVHAKVRGNAQNKAEDQAGLGVNVASGRGDACEACNDTVQDGQGRRAMAPPGNEKPDTSAHARANLGGGDGGRREGTGAERAACVKAKPAHPQKTGTESSQRHVGGWELAVVLVKPLATTEKECANKAACASSRVNDNAASKVERAELGEPAVAPNPVRHRVVDENLPQNNDEHEGAELETLCERARHEQRGDGGKHHLEEGKHSRGNGWRVRRAARERHVQEERIVKGANDATLIGAESERVAKDVPHGAEHGNAAENLRNNRQGVLGAQQACLEKGQRRHHAQHEHKRDGYPCSVARVDIADSVVSESASVSNSSSSSSGQFGHDYRALA